MEKVFIVNVAATVPSDGKRRVEFEPTELNSLLSDGWSIVEYKIVEKEGNSAYSIVYTLRK